MDLRKERIQNILNSLTNNTVIVPIDHGIGGVPQYLEDPIEAFKRFSAIGIDGVLCNFGLLKLLRSGVAEVPNNVGTIMTIDYIHTWANWKVNISASEIIGHTITASIEQALKLKADAVKIFMALGLEREWDLKLIKNISDVVKECDRYDMPVMIEPTTAGTSICLENKDNPRIIADGCRIAVELGADILKAPYPYEVKDGKEIFSEICKNSHVPVIILGGPKKDSVRSILEIAKEGMECGATGTIFGRNVWQREPEVACNTIRALKDIVHRGAGVLDVMAKYGLK